jgi:hypothetical protein
MIADDHQRALLELQVNAPCGIGQDRSPNPHAAQHAHGKRDFLRRVALVEMNPPLHRRHRNASGFADNHLAGVPNRRGTRKMRDVGVGDASGIGEFVGKAAQAGTEHQRDSGTQWSSVQQILRRLFDARERIRGHLETVSRF